MLIRISLPFPPISLPILSHLSPIALQFFSHFLPFIFHFSSIFSHFSSIFSHFSPISLPFSPISLPFSSISLHWQCCPWSIDRSAVSLSSRTNQHSCGDVNNNCELILQYMCDPQIRDGATIGYDFLSHCKIFMVIVACL